MSKNPSGTLDACIAIVEAWAAIREAEEDSAEAYRTPAAHLMTPDEAAATWKAFEDRVRADRLLRSLPIPTPEQLAELRERVK